MPFDLDPDQTAFRTHVRTVAQQRLRPTAFERRHAYDIPTENVALLAELGILGIALPEAYGGGGQSELYAIIALEEIARACPVTGDVATMALTGPPSFLAQWGTEEQKSRYLPPVCAGRERFVISLTEPEAGSALTDLRTRAEVVGDTCTINGGKIFCSGAATADHILVFVRFGPGTDGIGAVIVHQDTPGLTVGTPRRHFGGAPWSELTFVDATVPVGDVLFTGHAFRKLMASYTLERCGAGAFVLGIAQLALDLAVDYVQQRQQFGRPIAEFQFVQGRLADMYLAIEGARLLLYRAIEASDQGLPSRLQGSAAKLAATEAACLVTDSAMQLFGGSGMSQDMPLEWLYRVVRPYTVAGGTSDIHRGIIASELVGRKLSSRAGAR